LATKRPSKREDISSATEAAQREAAAIAKKYGFFDCDACVKEIARRVRRRIETAFERLRTADNSDIIGLATEDVQVSANRVHVGIRIGELVFDNHHPAGVPADQWETQFITATGAPLLHDARPTREFFGKVFLAKRFNQWLFGR
jgi:papain fold toxin 2 of polymorphic toxin system